MTKSKRVATACNGNAGNILRIFLRIDMLMCFANRLKGGKKGSLAVPLFEDCLRPINIVSRHKKIDFVIDVQDNHGPKHGSFAINLKVPEFAFGTLYGVQQQAWPVHGLRNEHGTERSADFVRGLDRTMVSYTILKGGDDRVDSYGAFADNGGHAPVELKAHYPFLGQSTGLSELIARLAHERGVDEVEVVIGGVALGPWPKAAELPVGYCVTFTAMQAREQTYKGKPYRVVVLSDCCGAIGDKGQCLQDLRDHGFDVTTSREYLHRGR